MPENRVVEDVRLPRHIGIIMDGNGRWAAKRGLPRTAGHKQGAKVVGDITRCCRDMGIQYLTLFAFSTENWSRPKSEVDGIMDLLREYLRETEKYQDENVRTCFIGERTLLAQDLQDRMKKVEEDSAGHTGLCLNIALNYGGRDEIIHATRQIAELVKSGAILSTDIDDDFVSSCLYTAGQPDPDLIIRPSGEQRLSNFMLWQAAYSELVFMDVLWPDFTPKRLKQALSLYADRSRRFGGL